MAVRNHAGEGRFLAAFELVPVVADDRLVEGVVPAGMGFPATLAVFRPAHAGTAVEDVEKLVITLRIGLHEQLPVGPDLGPMVVENLERPGSQGFAHVVRRRPQSIHQGRRVVVEANEDHAAEQFHPDRAQPHPVAVEADRLVGPGLGDVDATPRRVERPEMVEALDTVVGYRARAFPEQRRAPVRADIVVGADRSFRVAQNDQRDAGKRGRTVVAPVADLRFVAHELPAPREDPLAFQREDFRIGIDPVVEIVCRRHCRGSGPRHVGRGGQGCDPSLPTG